MAIDIYQPHLDWIDSRHNTMIATVIKLANINSGSQNIAGIAAIEDEFVKLLSSLKAHSQTYSLEPMTVINESGLQSTQEVGDAISWQKHANAPLQILLMGHMDTVYGENHPFQHCQWLDKNILNGPGVADLKGGLVIMITALQALENSPWAGKIGWQVLLNPDEEIGSLSSSVLINAIAKKHHLGLIFEPSLPDGTLAAARKGSGNFTVIITGKAAHAGREHHLGRNAIRALSDFTVELDNLNEKLKGISVNPGLIHGGGPVNIVPDKAILKFNVRISKLSDEKWFNDQLAKLVEKTNNKDGIDIQIHGKFSRTPKVIDNQTLKLFRLIRSTGKLLDMQINFQNTGGCCDGNNLAAAGLANVDTMGAIGGAIHSSDEYIDVSSLTQRAKLTALLLMQLASGQLNWQNNQVIK